LDLRLSERRKRSELIIKIGIVLPVFFIALYHFLITREEAFLAEEFGEEYKAYMRAVPRLLPRLSLYKAPELVEVNPKFLAKSFKDAVW
jgi:hypothetical protein